MDEYKDVARFIKERYTDVKKCIQLSHKGLEFIAYTNWNVQEENYKKIIASL